ncbi:MAG: hypothetical protein ICV75_02600 [Nitrospiraceae bacterium]|nr:hypothetical protein [Nitrospiraceae bacterium]
MPATDVLFYPFHLCHDRTLHQLLETFTRVHFRDYMALQLSPFFGTTAYPDRMGDTHRDLLAAGRLVQGYHVSGTLPAQIAGDVDRDFSDFEWRVLFHAALHSDPRFRIGLFGTSPETPHRQPIPADGRFKTHPFTVAQLSQMSLVPDSQHDAAFGYGLALLKTASALVYTVHLASKHALAVATDSFTHYALLSRSIGRDGVRLENRFIDRTGY